MSFMAQDWPCLEAVVFNTTDRKLNPPRGIREIRLRAMPQAQMLGLCRHNADGQYCVVLEDDTWYGQGLVTTLMEHAEQDALVLLRRKVRYSVQEQRGYLVEDDSIVCPLFPRVHPAPYGPKLSEMAAQFQYVRHADGPVDLMVKFTR